MSSTPPLTDTHSTSSSTNIHIISLPQLSELQSPRSSIKRLLRRTSDIVSSGRDGFILDDDDDDVDEDVEINQDTDDGKSKDPSNERMRTESKISTISVTSTTHFEDIVKALIGNAGYLIPGEEEDDRDWKYRRWMPTMVLYDEIGLRIYDRITAEATEYYLYNAELELFKQHGKEIGLAMGFPGGDAENVDEMVRKGWDVGELGAGSLKKTSHLLTSLASLIPPTSNTPITYLPLDLSRPELVRTLSQLEETIGSSLQGKVRCKGLWGDYERGLEFVRQGGLMELREGESEEEVGSEEEGSEELGNSINSIKLGTVTPLDTPPASEDSDDVKVTSTGKLDGDARPLHLLFLGSSLGNFDREGAVPFLSSLPLRPGRGDTLLLGLDGRPSAQGVLPDGTPDFSKGKDKVERAYNDHGGVTREFIMHGLEVADAELRGLSLDDAKKGKEGRIIELEKWEYAARYNVPMGRHEAYYRSKVDQTILLDREGIHTPKIQIAKGELLNIEWSYKYSIGEAQDLFERAGLRLIQSWKDPGSEYRLYLLEKAPFQFPLLPTLGSKVMPAAGVRAERKGEWECVPTKAEWRDLWKFWDTVTLGMIPDELLHQRPIDLRHKCLFYLGHIPTFLDIHLTRILKAKHTEPAHYKDIFERGIDPHVDDPTQIHPHSEVPNRDEDWPTLSEILAFRDRVRERLVGIYDEVDAGRMKLSRRMGRVLFMVFEHEAMHAETLLYMLLQSSLTLPPPGFSVPQWSSLAEQWEAEFSPSKVITFTQPTIVVLGHDDKESEDHLVEGDEWESHEFGWDCEHAKQSVVVKPFKVESLPVTNLDYLSYMKTAKITEIPASWVADGGSYLLRTLYGSVPFSVGQHWPLMASGEELQAYAKWKGGRLPTEAELIALWSSDEGPRPAGREANVGLKRWHPVPPTNTRLDSNGSPLYGHNGGVWEWTSSEFAGLKGYEQSEVYPGFSSDFFDGLHNVVLGGSFATIPRLAARSSWRNFYQTRYRYAWIGGRVAFDV